MALTPYFKARDEKNLRVVDECCTTLPPSCTEYFNDVSLARAATTMANYARKLNQFFRWVHDEIITDKDVTSYTFDDLSSITSDDVMTYMQILKHSGDSDETLRAHLCAISSFYNHFVKKRKIGANPVDGVMRPKHKKAPKIYLDNIDANRFETAVKTGAGLTEHVTKYNDTIGSRNRDIVIMSLLSDTGIRISELVGLDVKSVDMKRCRVSVQRKGGDISIVYFSNDTLEYLEAYLKDRDKIADKQETALLLSFVGSNKGHRISVRSVEILVKKYAEAAGVTNAGKMTPHKLRHTCGMSLLKATGNIALVQKQLGHRNITSTTVYAEADDSDLSAVRNLRREGSISED